MSEDKGRSEAAAQSTPCSFLARASKRDSFRQGKANLPPPVPTNGAGTVQAKGRQDEGRLLTPSRLRQELDLKQQRPSP